MAAPRLLGLAFVALAAPILAADPPTPDKNPEQLLKHRDAKTRWRAAESLWKRDHEPARLVPVFSELLTAEDPNIRAASAWRLGRMGSAARHAVPMLAASLRDENYEVRLQVGLALANLGAFAEPALPALLRTLADANLDELSSFIPAGEIRVRTSPSIPALVELADSAIPALIRKFPTKFPARSAWVMPAFGTRAIEPLLRALDSKNDPTRQNSLLGLTEIGRIHGLPKSAIDKMEKRLEDKSPDVRREAAFAMSWLRPSNEKAAAIVLGSSSDTWFQEGDFILALKRIAPHCDGARKRLFTYLEDKGLDASSAAARHILESLELAEDQALELWTRSLGHPKEKARSLAVNSLWQFGSRAKSAKPALRRLFDKEPDAILRSDILRALTTIDPNDPELLPFLEKSLDHPGPYVRDTAVNCLARLGPKAKSALPKLTATLLSKANDDTDPRDADTRSLIFAIASIDPTSKKSASVLLEALRQPKIRSELGPKHAWLIREILEDELLGYLPVATPMLREALKDRDAQVRHSAALILLRAGLDLETALPILMDKLDRENERFRERAIHTVMRREHGRSQAVAKACCRAWATANGAYRAELAVGILGLQPEALPLLIDQLRRAESKKAKRDLAHLLAWFEEPPKQIVPILRAQLLDSDDTQRIAAAKSLGHLGPHAAKAVPELLQLTKHRHPGMRGLAVETLGNIGPSARPAIPTLKAMLKDEKPARRVVAAVALARIDPSDSQALEVLLTKFVAGDWNRDDAKIDSFLADTEFSTSLVFVGWVAPLQPVEDSILRFGERGVTALAKIVDNTDLDEWRTDNLSAQCGSEARLRAVRLLADIGPDSKSAIPALVRALDDFDPFIRENAASALGRIGPAARAAVPHLIGQLERDNQRTSLAKPWATTTEALANRGQSARRYDDIPFDFRVAGRSRNAPRALFYDLRRDPFNSVRPKYPFDPVYVLSRIDTESRTSLPILKQMAKDADHPRRLAAALAVSRLDGDDTPLVSAFSDTLEAYSKFADNSAPPLTREMRECLAELGPLLKPMMPTLANVLTKHTYYYYTDDRVRIIDALGRLGPSARPVLHSLRPFLEEGEDEVLRVAAAEALFRITGERERTFSTLREIWAGAEEKFTAYYIPDMTDTRRVRSVRALATLAEQGDKRAHALLEATAKGDENDHVRDAAREVLNRSN